MNDKHHYITKKNLMAYINITRIDEEEAFKLRSMMAILLGNCL